MTTSVMTLSEFAELAQNLAEEWDGGEPAVVIGDRHGDINVSAKDGHTKHGSVAFAQELFDGNGVMELGQLGDTRFYGAMLFDVDDLGDDAAEQLRETDYNTDVGGDEADA